MEELWQALVEAGDSMFGRLFIGGVTSILLVWATSFLIFKGTVSLFARFYPERSKILARHKVPKKTAALFIGLLAYFNLSHVIDYHPNIYFIWPFFKKLILIYTAISFALAILSIASALEDIYKKQKISKKIPLTPYLQTLKVVLWGLMSILIISVLLNRSPVGFFTGLGAFAAILSFVFQDTIKSFITMMQIAAYDIVRLGDWISVPQYGADGDVLEISLTSVKIQNFDKTISTIPTSALLTTGVKNWRNMQESGARRIKRALFIDIDKVRFCTPQMIETFKEIPLLKQIILKIEKGESFPDYVIDSAHPLTNLGIFRLYVNEFLRQHPNIHKDNFTFLIRQLDPTEKGIPIELYIFTNDARWVHYENIQSGIFDHLIAVLPQFGLRAYQDITSAFPVFPPQKNSP